MNSTNIVSLSTTHGIMGGHPDALTEAPNGEANAGIGL
jgi:hypothetical protein